MASDGAGSPVDPASRPAERQIARVQIGRGQEHRFQIHTSDENFYVTVVNNASQSIIAYVGNLFEQLDGIANVPQDTIVISNQMGELRLNVYRSGTLRVTDRELPEDAKIPVQMRRIINHIVAKREKDGLLRPPIQASWD